MMGKKKSVSSLKVRQHILKVHKYFPLKGYVSGAGIVFWGIEKERNNYKLPRQKKQTSA